MAYIDGCVTAVPTANKEAYLAFARETDVIFKDLGAVQIVDAWGDDVPEGKVTDFRRAVQATADETVVFSWVKWPDKATRDAAWAKAMEDPRMKDLAMPFDGKRMVFGGFEVLLEA
jgi:uncharacterized protein YbaA (DUF1428 family)